jgi:PQQ-dependent dehydrogenase (s-GDH family)
VFSAGSTSINSGATFDITVSGPPSNDECNTATTLSNGVTNSSGTVWNATASAGIPVGCATGNPDDDVWYKYTTPSGSVSATITLSAIGTDLSTSGALIQMFTGSCGSLTSFACGNTSVSAAVSPSTQYYIRVYSAGTGSIGSTPSGSVFSITATAVVGVNYTAGRMNEVFQQTILSGANVLNTPWEITYGPDNYLWVTESKKYKAYRMNPITGATTTILDISQGASGYLTPTEHTTFNCQFPSTQSPWPQGGFAGLALHPKFLDSISPKNYVYISYVRKYDSASVITNGGYYFRNSLVRFTYNTSTGKLESPVALCDTLPGSNDHNSQRIIIAPVGGTYYLFYAQGDMGAGQLSDQWRPNKAQNPNSYEGKILRFNLEPDGDADAYQQWIPNDNPISSTSAVWALGIRNNQGFAYDTAKNILYGTSHGPYSDDELNIIEENKNYGHPLVIGYADGNYNGSNAGTPNTTSSLAPITDEVAAAAAIPNYKDPLYSAYAPPAGNSTTPGTIKYIWTNNPSNSTWPSEAWSGMDFYSNILIPGWKNSLVIASLKWARVLRLKLGPTGTTILPTNGADTVAYWGGTNRYRDIAFAPNGKDIFVSMEGSSTSGPAANNPVVPACANCVVKYTFLGYADASGKSSIPDAIDVTAGSPNTCSTGTTVTIDNSNNNLWVPITGPDGNVMAEIYANGNVLGTVTSSFYTNATGTVRMAGGTKYLDRNLTITPQFQPSSAVKIRLYMSKAEFDALDADPLGGVTTITDLKILKNTDPCSSALSNTTTLISPTFAEAHGTGGYMLQGNINSFSSFYFASSNITLPQQLLTFTGTLQNNATHLNWETANEINTSHYELERSTDAADFKQISSVPAKGSSSNSYSYVDNNVANLMSPVVYYRLKMVDNSGSFTYSKVISVTFSSSYNVYIYPNPMHDILKIKLSLATAQNLQISITDVKGHTIYRKSKFAGAGTGEFEINTKYWPSQMYSVKIVGNNQEVLTVKNVVKL